MDTALQMVMNAEFNIDNIVKDPSPLHHFVLEYYRVHGRVLPWRKSKNPYHVFISEVMLQQTQVSRVTERFRFFINEAPDFKSLAALPTKKLLSLWQGLGYNRRALYLREAARVITETYSGVLPDTQEALRKLKGIGPNTASSICAFAFNKPVGSIYRNKYKAFLYSLFF